jgi:hypothetical protein
MRRLWSAQTNEKKKIDQDAKKWEKTHWKEKDNSFVGKYAETNMDNIGNEKTNVEIGF